MCRKGKEGGKDTKSAKRKGYKPPSQDPHTSPEGWDSLLISTVKLIYAGKQMYRCDEYRQR